MLRMAIPAVLAAALAGSAALAAPIAPLAGVSPAIEHIAFRGGNWHDHPMMYSDYYYWHQRQWDAIEGRRSNARASCARFRSYDRRTHTYLNRNGRRVACR